MKTKLKCLKGIFTIALLILPFTYAATASKNNIKESDLVGKWVVTSIQKNKKPVLTDVNINFEFILNDKNLTVLVKPDAPSMHIPTIPASIIINNKQQTLRITPSIDELPPILEPALQALGAPFLTNDTVFQIKSYEVNSTLMLETIIEDLDSSKANIIVTLKKQ